MRVAGVGSKRMNRPYVYGCGWCKFKGSFEEVKGHETGCEENE